MYSLHLSHQSINHGRMLWAHTISGQRAADPPRGPLFCFVLYSLRLGLNWRPAGLSVQACAVTWCEHQTAKTTKRGIRFASDVQTTARRVRLQPAGPLRCRFGGLETWSKRLREREAADASSKVRPVVCHDRTAVDRQAGCTRSWRNQLFAQMSFTIVIVRDPK